MDLEEKRLDGRGVYSGVVIDVRVDTVILPDGRRAKREVAEHSGGVAVLALDDKDQVVMVRQWRYPVGQALLEIPAGKLERGEDPRACGLRELREETGFVPRSFEPLGKIYPSPGYSDEILYLYLARGLRYEGENPDEDEFLCVERMPFNELERVIASGEITDAKTITAAYRTRLRLWSER